MTLPTRIDALLSEYKYLFDVLIELDNEELANKEAINLEKRIHEIKNEIINYLGI